MASKISHDLWTPLNVILRFGQVLQMEPLNARQAEAVGYTIEAGRQLHVLLDEGLERVRATLASQPATTTSPQPRGGDEGGNSRVLCIEDSVENVERLKAVVRRLPGV